MKNFLLKIFAPACALLASASVFAQESGATEEKGQGFFQTIIMIVIALVFFYFILWRPEQKRRKAMEKRRSSIKQGDRVTAMGIIGTVLRVLDNTVILKLYDGAKVEVLKAAITDVQQSSEETSEKKVEELKDAQKSEAKNGQ